MTALLIIIALLMAPEEPITVDQTDWYSGPVTEEEITDDGFSLSTEGENAK